MDNLSRNRPKAGESAFLIDGYNLLHRIDDLARWLHRDPAAARTLLYKELMQLRKLPPERMRVIMDGARLPDEEVPDGLAVHWAIKPDTADDRILKLLLREARRQSAARDWIVVSDDRELAARARERGARILPCLAFLEQSGFREPAPAPPPGSRPAATSADGVRVRKGGGRMSDAELAWWLKTFEADPDATVVDAADGSSPSDSSPRPRVRSDEDARYLRMMGVDSDDPRILEQEDEDWPDED